MKKLFYLPALAAALFFTSCSSDEPAGPNNGEVNENGGYLAVNIVTPAGSRGTDAGFENGDATAGENTANKAMFLFFDDKGNPTQTPQIVDLTWPTTDQTTETPAVEKISEAIVSVAGKTKPAQMLVVLNPGSIRLAGQSLAQVLATTGQYAASAAGTFIMTNTAYYDDKIVVTTPLSADDVKDTKDDAKTAAKDVYVERVVAKIRITDGGLLANVGNTDITADNEEYTIVPVIHGIEVANIAQQSYLFKNIDKITDWMATDQWPTVNDKENKRSYWATPYADKTFANQSWTGVTGDITDLAKNKFYVQENTNMSKQTSILITAELKYRKKGTTDELQPVELVKWAGNYYMKNQFLSRFITLINNEGYEIVTLTDGKATEHRQFETGEARYLTDAEHKALREATTGAGSDIRAFETAGRLSYELKANEVFAKNVTVTGENINYTGVEAKDINDFLLQKANRVWLWNQKSYYYVPIEHFGPVKTPIDFSHGVVRNHIYELNLKSLTGLGTPVVDASEEIIPEKPDEDLFYVAAKINILKWRVVKQDVNFTD